MNLEEVSWHSLICAFLKISAGQSELLEVFEDFQYIPAPFFVILLSLILEPVSILEIALMVPLHLLQNSVGLPHPEVRLKLFLFVLGQD